MDQDGVSVPKVTYSFVSCAGRATVVGLSVCLSVCLTPLFLHYRLLGSIRAIPTVSV